MIRKYIARSTSPVFSPVKLLFYRLHNKYYPVNDLIKKSEIIENDWILVELANGIKLATAPSKYKADNIYTDVYRFGDKSKLKKIIGMDKYFFLYEVISELFLNSKYFKYFDVKKNDLVVDAGANIGGFTVQAAKKLNNTGRIIAIEPDDQNIDILQKNIEINNIKNVDIVKKGLWSKKEIKKFFISTRPGEHTLFDHEVSSDKKANMVTEIHCDTLDNMCTELDLNEINYLKMDIEGAEIEALKGAENVIKNFNTNWYIEAEHLVDGHPSYETLIPFLEQRGARIMEPIDRYRGTIFAQTGKH